MFISLQNYKGGEFMKIISVNQIKDVLTKCVQEAKANKKNFQNVLFLSDIKYKLVSNNLVAERWAKELLNQKHC